MVLKIYSTFVPKVEVKALFEQKTFVSCSIANATQRVQHCKCYSAGAQPTPTEPLKPPKTGKKERQETEAKEEPTREPEKATQGKEQTKEETETMTKTKK